MTAALHCDIRRIYTSVIHLISKLHPTMYSLAGTSELILAQLDTVY